jgi:dTDP-4-dehydrorhamnose 3,5-epimerase-like enzyme
MFTLSIMPRERIEANQDVARGGRIVVKRKREHRLASPQGRGTMPDMEDHPAVVLMNTSGELLLMLEDLPEGSRGFSRWLIIERGERDGDALLVQRPCGVSRLQEDVNLKRKRTT